MHINQSLNFQHDRSTRASYRSRLSITVPANNASYPITANAADSDGTITKVDFYNGATLLNTDSTAPYSVTLAGFNLGSYTFTAVATDNSGASTTSAPVNISISQHQCWQWRSTGVLHPHRSTQHPTPDYRQQQRQSMGMEQRRPVCQ